ncbi:MAG: ABC transporter permease, partial [Bacteroidota bacterium]
METPTPPPRWPEKLLNRCCPEAIREFLLGDLYELYELRIDRLGKARANLWLVLDTFSALRPFGFQNHYKNSNHLTMLVHHLKIAFRHFNRHRAYTLINALGLAVSLACCLLIGVYLKHELSYDRHHQNAERIYRLTREFLNADGSTSIHIASLAPPFVPYMREDFPEMEAITRFSSFDNTFYIEGKHYVQYNIAAADDSFFKVFPLAFVSGDPTTALSQPKSMVLTEEAAMKYYRTTEVVGKTFPFSSENTYIVTGVIKEMPENSHFRLEMIVDFSWVEARYNSNETMMRAWHANDLSTYFLLKKDASVAAIEQRFPKFFIDHMGPDVNRWTALHTQKLTDIHLHSNLDDEKGQNGSIAHIYTFSIAGLLILVISIINYVNLTTAMSIKRAKEVGVRKVLGAGRPLLINQFMIESVVLVSIALLAAFVLAFLALPYLRGLTGSSYAFGWIEVLQALGAVSAVGTVIGLLAGGYPAFFISNFQPLSALKSSLSTGSKGSRFRRVLVIVQFAISSILILSTALVFQQLEYIKGKNLG